MGGLGGFCIGLRLRCLRSDQEQGRSWLSLGELGEALLRACMYKETYRRQGKKGQEWVTRRGMLGLVYG